jgi:hypothetical protein
MSITSLRIPDDLLNKVKAEAERTHRSMNSELLWLIERGLESGETAKGRQ